MLMTKPRAKIDFARVVIPLALALACVFFSTAEAEQTDVSIERTWTDQANELIQKAGTGQADGRLYTAAVRSHRAELRQLMQHAGKDISPQRQQLHMSMVLLGVLLKTAAGCQAGGHVVCPASLMLQLRAVLKNTYIKVELYETGASA